MIVLLGGTGQLGRALRQADPQLHAPTHADLDLADWRSVHDYIATRRPRWVINAAAQHDARQAEQNPTPDLLLNAAAPHHLALDCALHGTRLLHLSTNYVYGGDTRTGPFAEFEYPAPVTAYGIAKHAGELLVRAASPDAVIVRTACLFGPGLGDGFPTKYVLNGNPSYAMYAVTDQWVTPTYAPDLAQALLQLIAHEAKGGVYHLVGAGQPVTWYEYAQQVLTLAQHQRALIPVTTQEYGEGVPRPRHSALLNTRAVALYGIRMRPWLDGLRAHLGCT